jgi:hypothetical protein
LAFDSIHRAFGKRHDQAELSGAHSWLLRNWARVDFLFKNRRLATYVFEPVAELWDGSTPTTDDQIKRLISQVALANAVIAGLPGKLGIGVAVAIALETYMAIQIARRIGVEINSLADAAKYFTTGVATALTIFVLFRHLLGFFFSIFSLVGFLPATALAELFATSLIGILFWIGFSEVRENGSFQVPRRLLKTAWARATDLTKYQYRLIRRGFTLQTYKETGQRIADWLSGENLFAPPMMRGDIFVPLAMAILLHGRTSELQGPLGQIFIQAIRDTVSDLSSATDLQIADSFRERFTDTLGQVDTLALQGMESLVRGRMFELMVKDSVVWNGDGWSPDDQSAELHEDFNHPGTDIVFTNAKTGETVEVQIKATSSSSYIEDTLLRYPDYPIIVTSEVGAAMEDNDMLQSTFVSNEYLRTVTQENFDELLDDVTPLTRLETAGSAVIGGGASALAQIWPFFVAYARGSITGSQLSEVIKSMAPKTGARVARHVLLGAAVGPVYAWWILARAVMGVVPSSQGNSAGRYLLKLAPNT